MKPGISIMSLTTVFGMNHANLRKLFKEYDIPKKSPAQVTIENSSSKPKTKLPASVYAQLADKDWLLEQLDKKQTIPGIAATLGCSVTPVISALRKFNIETDGRRPNNDTNRLLQDYTWMHENYVVANKSMATIAEEIGSSQATVHRWIHFHELDITPPNTYPRKHVNVSRPCQEIVDFISSLHEGPVILNDRSICARGLEIDIVVPNARLAIEYHGIFSHIHRPDGETFSLRKGPDYHILKTMECERAGLKLYQFFSDEWREKRAIIESMIRVDLGQATRIFARKCTVHHLDTATKNTFLHENHLQGADKSKYKYGLFYGEELVAVMTFAKPRFNKHCNWELTRFAVKQNIAVVGGFSKLLKHAQRDLIDGSIVSYADRRYSQRKVYEKNGFTKSKVNPPSYCYADISKDARYHRMNFQKKNLQGDKSKTEFQLATEMGFSRIYDCGTITYTLEV